MLAEVVLVLVRRSFGKRRLVEAGPQGRDQGKFFFARTVFPLMRGSVGNLL